MRLGRGHALALATSLVLLVTGAAHAQDETQLVLGAHLYPKPRGLTYVYGHIKPPLGVPLTQFGGQTVVMYESVFPFLAWQQIATLTTDWQGYFSLSQTIAQNTAYRAVWQTNPPLQSKDRLVTVPLEVTLSARARGSHVTFSGATSPPHPGALVALQEIDKHGRFRTVGTARLAPTNSFQRSWRLRRGGVFRALVKGDGLYGVGVSRPLRVR
jgi:hypothetical protein